MRPSTIRGIVAYRKGRWYAEIALSFAMICAGGYLALDLQGHATSGPGAVASPEATACFIAFLALALLIVHLLNRAGEALRKETGFSSITALLDAEGGDGE